MQRIDAVKPLVAGFFGKTVVDLADIAEAKLPAQKRHRRDVLGSVELADGAGHIALAAVDDTAYGDIGVVLVELPAQ